MLRPNLYAPEAIGCFGVPPLREWFGVPVEDGTPIYPIKSGVNTVKEGKMPQTAPANPIANLIPLVLIFVVFYFLLIRPQKAKEKEHQKMIGGLNKNDEVVTSGGIHGTVINVKDRTVTLRIDDNVKVEIEKTCIAFLKKNPDVTQGA